MIDVHFVTKYGLASIPLLIVTGLIIFLLRLKSKLPARNPLNERQHRHQLHVEHDVVLNGAKKVGKKKLESIKRKQDKKQYSLALEAQRDEQKRIQEIKEEEEEEILSKQRKAEAKESKLELQRREALKLEQQAHAEQIMKQREALIKFKVQLVDEVKRLGIVNVPELAFKYEMKPDILADMLLELTQTSSLNGIFDAKGRYIDISDDELDKVGAFINEKGRIQRDQLSQFCESLIKMRSSTT